MKPNFKTFLLITFMLQGFVYSQQNQLQLNLSNISPVIDGILTEGEWGDAKEIQLFRTPEWKIDVLVKYDTEFIYVAFTNLESEELTRINPEILIQTNLDSNEWDANCYWFHSSYSNCFSNGEYYNWDLCSKNSPDWKANTFPFINGNNNIEYQINFSKLKIALPSSGMKLKIAFKLSDASELHTYWPKGAAIELPDSWGELIF